MNAHQQQYNYDTIQPQGPPPAYDDTASEDDFKYGVNVADSDPSIRMAFVRKVYAILSVQMLATVALSMSYMFNAGIKAWVRSNSWSVVASSILAIGLLFAVIWQRRNQPWNMILLSAFTLLEAHAVATVVTFYSERTVLNALLLTLGLFIGLTLFTLQTKMDFSGFGPFLFGTLVILVVLGLIQLIFPFGSLLNLVIAFVTAVLFCGYIVYDTQAILERMSPEEYVMAAIELYLDIINLFLAILRIFGGNGDSSD
ncbi:inhibitor of apoptosis-promoting Bax1-domain-containing protein [Entophlyctis helioformis]|nr:inhibitor of apoptosis-promoting Bax1-domain-containing protein [Entophlyctis helioformis]